MMVGARTWWKSRAMPRAAAAASVAHSAALATPSRTTRQQPTVALSPAPATAPGEHRGTGAYQFSA